MADNGGTPPPSLEEDSENVVDDTQAKPEQPDISLESILSVCRESMVS